MIEDILFEKAVFIMAANHPVGQVHVFDDRPDFSAVPLSEFPAEDHGDFARLPEGPIGRSQPPAHRLRRSHSDFLDFWLLTPMSPKGISRAKPLAS